MCGRFTLTGPGPQELRARFGIADDVPVAQRWNIAPGQQVLALTSGENGRPGGESLRWGLLPAWAKEAPGGRLLINARAETVAEKPSFRDALLRHRCLIPADGFYEWQPCSAGPKQPYWITRADHAPFAFAGLWATWRSDHGGPELRSCAIITTAASEQVLPIHDRMPAILNPQDEARWLDEELADDSALALLQPFAALEARTVSSAVNDARVDAPELVEPAPTAEHPAMDTLF
ncbi:unannotated protein [freshwater metagenome]|uniref:Unannotated protein n=1 Tax=freshwater metagenome TaxID=449393 RepID=A0A6J7EJH8_9ZZZZ|nr:hypothetical protein [Actinomycetota bacterium]